MEWVKEGLIFSPNKRYEWMFSHAQIPFPYDFGNFLRVYFATREDYREGLCRSYGGFVDLDKNNLKCILRISDKPIMPLGKIGEFDEFGVMPASMIKIKDKYFMYYCGWTRAVSTPHKEAIGIAISHDGEEFNKLGRGPLISESLYEPYLHSYPIVYHFEEKYHMFYHTGVEWLEGVDRQEPQYLIRHAISEDGIEWKRDYINILETKVDFESQTSPTIFYLNGIYHMYFCYRCSLDFRMNRERGYRIGYATSRDLKIWRRDDSQAGITLSDDGWDSQMIEYPSIIKLNNRYVMFYCGNDFGKMGFGYALLKQ